VFKNVTNLIVNNVYTLELILILFGTLYVECTDNTQTQHYAVRTQH